MRQLIDVPPIVLLTLVVACDGRLAPAPAASAERFSARVGEAGAVALARPAPHPACPGVDFPGFVAAFAEDTAVQARYTRFPLEDAELTYGVDDAGRGETGEVVRRVPRTAVRWPLLPPRALRRADTLELQVDALGRGGHLEAVVYKPDTDWQVAYVFVRDGGCWRLVRREDRSL